MDFPKTFVINIFGGPGCGKSVLQAQIYVALKKLGFSCEMVQESAKKLVLKKDWNTLNNQYMVSTNYAKDIEVLIGKVQFIILDSSILTGLYHNEFNEYNTSNVEKTKEQIYKLYNKFNNINLLLKRGIFPYESIGRTETLEKAKEIDNYFNKMLDESDIIFENVLAIIDEKDIINILNVLLKNILNDIQPNFL